MLEEKTKNILENLKQKLEEAQKRNLVFLLVGRTDVGKPITVNSLMGKEVAKVGDYEPTTMGIEEYNSKISKKFKK